MKKLDQHICILLLCLSCCACSNTVYVESLEPKIKATQKEDCLHMAEEMPPEVLNGWIPPGISHAAPCKKHPTGHELVSTEWPEPDFKDRFNLDKKKLEKIKMDMEIEHFTRVEQQKNEIKLRTDPPGAHRAENLKRMPKVDLPKVDMKPFDLVPNVRLPDTHK